MPTAAQRRRMRTAGRVEKKKAEKPNPEKNGRNPCMPPESPIFPWIGPFGLHSTPLAAVASPFLSVGPIDLHSPLLASISLYWPPFPSITPVFPWISPIGLHLPLLDSIPLCWPPFPSIALIFPCIGLSGLHSPLLASYSPLLPQQRLLLIFP